MTKDHAGPRVLQSGLLRGASEGERYMLRSPGLSRREVISDLAAGLNRREVISALAAGLVTAACGRSGCQAGTAGGEPMADERMNNEEHQAVMDRAIHSLANDNKDAQ